MPSNVTMRWKRLSQRVLMPFQMQREIISRQSGESCFDSSDKVILFPLSMLSYICNDLLLMMLPSGSRVRLKSCRRCSVVTLGGKRLWRTILAADTSATFHLHVLQQIQGLGLWYFIEVTDSYCRKRYIPGGKVRAFDNSHRGSLSIGIQRDQHQSYGGRNCSQDYDQPEVTFISTDILACNITEAVQRCGLTVVTQTVREPVLNQSQLTNSPALTTRCISHYGRVTGPTCLSWFGKLLLGLHHA